MAFLIAIVGRYGVGKSLLGSFFEKKGISPICIEEAMLTAFGDDQHAATWRSCITHQYQDLQSIVPMLSKPEAVDAICHAVEKEQGGMVVLPSFLRLEALMEKGIFDYVVSVDCVLALQKKYLLECDLDESVVEILLKSGESRQYYSGFATDVFLNSVTIEKIEWVADQMIKTYQLVDKYK